MDEFELIRRYFVLPATAPGVIAGIGDDGAVLQPAPGRQIINVIDTLVEGVHFLSDMDAADIAYRSVAVNLSDIAAMGGRPRWMMLALTLRDANDDWMGRFAGGLHAAGAEYNVALVGGDTTQGDSIVVSVQMTGDVEDGFAMRRSGANVGDTIFVTGTVGDAAAGLELIRSGRPDPYLSARFLRPSPRVEFGQALTGIATAAIDLSDGLYADLQKMLTASGVGGVIDLDCLPLSEVLRSTFNSDSVRQFALSGGDDYELCFTANADNLPNQGDLRVTAIGSVTTGDRLLCRDAGKILKYKDKGYRHFK